MTDYTISSKLSNETVYAYYRGRFWRWDGSIWKESHLMTQKFERARAADKNLTPQAFLTNGAEFAPLDEYEIDCAMLDALENAKPCKNAPIEPVEEHPTPSAQCSDAATAAESQTAASPAAPEESNPTTELATAADAPGVPVSADENAPVPSSTAPTFDFGADDQTNALLLQDAQTFITGNMARIMAAKHAHDLTANHYQGSWGKWCAAVGISRDTGDRMVSVAAQCGNIQLEGKSILDVQPLKLLYAAAKPSTPEVVKQAVFTGDITTYKEYQELMAQLKAEKSRADAAEKSAQNARKENAYFKELVKSAEAQTHKDAEKREEAESRYESALADISGLKEQNAQLKERADSAEAREEEAWKMQSKAEARAHKAEDALKHQPITGVVDKDEVKRQAEALSRNAVQEARQQAAEAQARLRQYQEDAEGLLAPAQACAQQAQFIADSVRAMYLKWFGNAVAADASLAQMGTPLYAVCGEIMSSLEEENTINPTAAGSEEDAEREALFE